MVVKEVERTGDGSVMVDNVVLIVLCVFWQQFLSEKQC